MKIFCDCCKGLFDDIVDSLDEFSCKICGAEGVYISETEMLMCYSLG